MLHWRVGRDFKLCPLHNKIDLAFLILESSTHLSMNQLLFEQQVYIGD